MNKLFIILLSTLMAMSLNALPEKPEDAPKALNAVTHTAGSIRLDASNYSALTEMIYPVSSSTRLLNIASPWISAKRYRRNSAGELLYWLAQYPSADSTGVVTINDPLWNPTLSVVVDTLSTVGFDGDKDLYELLPAHNPLSVMNPHYQAWNPSDKVLTSILGYPAPREFIFPDPQGTYCYTIPQDQTFNTPGLETLTSFYYDFCPFGTIGDRDLGASRNTSTHHPLGLAVHQQSYAWNLQNHDGFIIVKRIIYNTSLVDTLFDLAVAEYVDADINPSYNNGNGSADDVSGYVKGPGYEFAYTRDFDFDGGLAPNYLGHKIIVPYHDLIRTAWAWRVGDGPDDFYARSFNFAPRLTSNEKYWLSTGRQPNANKFTLIRPEQPDIIEYEQPTPSDTRFLNGVYGNQPTPGNTDPQGRLNLLPGMGKAFYSIYFVGSSLDDLKQRAQFVENFIMSGFDPGNITDLTCIPYLRPIQMTPPDTFILNWESYTDPAFFQVKYKVFDPPAPTWTEIQVAGNLRDYTLTAMDSETWYQIKVAAIYNPGPDEVYLESDTKLVSLSHPTEADNPEVVFQPALKVFPNPFNPLTTIEYQLSEPDFVRLSLYNQRGQLVKHLTAQSMPAGLHRLSWDGIDASGKPCASGVYYLKMTGNKHSESAKLLLMK